MGNNSLLNLVSFLAEFVDTGGKSEASVLRESIQGGDAVAS
jgi:hypothetical protein